MIAEAITKVLTLANKREPFFELQDGSKRIFLYSDEAREYKEISRVVVLKRSVSNIESFAAAVMETELRGSDPESFDGDNATVVFTREGAWYSPNDEVDLDRWAYNREPSPQWALTNERHSGVAHKDFLLLLQRLRPSMVDPGVLTQFRRLEFEASTNLISQPQMIDGKAGSAFAVQFQAKNGNGQSTVPSEILLRMPFARGSADPVEITAQVDIYLDESKEKKILRFCLGFPDRETVQEAAISREVAWFREQVKSLPRLLILEDY